LALSVALATPSFAFADDNGMRAYFNWTKAVNDAPKASSNPVPGPNATARLVHSLSECAPSEQLAAVWSDAPTPFPRLLGYSCEMVFY
jgi:hypothetical protein